MPIFDTVREAWSILTRNKVRSFLTMLGIIIGVTSVVVIMSVGAGAQGLVLTYRLDTLSYGRRTALTGTTQSGDNGNVNTIGAKGEGSYLRWSGTLFALPTLVDLIDPTGMSAGTVIGVGDLFFPWSSGMSLSL
jgi:ABC-type antimicrobial peptide transport system permease subunit